MTHHYKPDGYTSLSPYIVVESAQKLTDMLTELFDAKPLRVFKDDKGKILHGELEIDDSILMLADANEHAKPASAIFHVYVPDSLTTYEKALSLGCEGLGKPERKDNAHDTDMRGQFRDPWGNFWSVSTRQEVAS